MYYNEQNIKLKKCVTFFFKKEKTNKKIERERERERDKNRSFRYLKLCCYIE